MIVVVDAKFVRIDLNADEDEYHVVSRPTDPQVYRDIVLAVRSIENAPPATAHLIDFIRDYLARQKED